MVSFFIIKWVKNEKFSLNSLSRQIIIVPLQCKNKTMIGMKKLDLLKKYYLEDDVANYCKLYGSRFNESYLKRLMNADEYQTFINLYCSKCPPLLQLGESKNDTFFILKPLYSIINIFWVTRYMINSGRHSTMRYVWLFIKSIFSEHLNYIKYLYFPEKI